MKVLVTGGRNYADRVTLFGRLDAIHSRQPITLIIHGAASGADRLSGYWAASRKVNCQTFPADWKQHGRAAGPIRNSIMLEQKPDLVVAFPGGRGTADMVRKSKAAGLNVIEVEIT